MCTYIHESLFCFSDVLTCGVWKRIASDQNVSNNAYLKDLASSLQGTILAAKAGSTTDKYRGGWGRWKAFAIQFNLQTFPVKITYLALYIEHLKSSVSSIAPI